MLLYVDMYGGGGKPPPYKTSSICRGDPVWSPSDFNEELQNILSMIYVMVGGVLCFHKLQCKSKCL